MAEGNGISRRSVIKTAAAGACVALAGKIVENPGSAEAKTESRSAKKEATMKLKNSDFYDKKGKFQADKAKKAYFDMMEKFKYPVSQPLKKGIWILDFGLHDFVNVGMGGIFWLNDQEYGFFGHDIYLLPGQMIAEHAHMKTAKGPAKMEGWQVRCGMIHTLGEGDQTRPMPIKLPASQAKHITVRNCLPLMVGEVRRLNRLTAKHFMIAGPDGAIVTEYGTFHDNDGLRFSNPAVKLDM